VVIDKRAVEKGLVSKGFKKSNRGHRYFQYYSHDGKKADARTKTSHSPREKTIDLRRMREMAQQCGLEAREFVDLVQCPLERDDYERLLKQRSFL